MYYHFIDHQLKVEALKKQPKVVVAEPKTETKPKFKASKFTTYYSVHPLTCHITEEGVYYTYNRKRIASVSIEELKEILTDPAKWLKFYEAFRVIEWIHPQCIGFERYEYDVYFHLGEIITRDYGIPLYSSTEYQVFQPSFDEFMGDLKREVKPVSFPRTTRTGRY